MFNNPYFYGVPNMVNGASGIRGLIRSINWASLLNNTSKTLGVINQAIPVVYQVKPILNNAKTMFKIAGALNSSDNVGEKINTNSFNNSNQPIFYI